VPLPSEMVHASTVAIGGHAVLIEGVSGSGKSDLALRLIDRGATLISDDYTLVRRGDAGLLACAAPNIEGRIEVRGIGIVALPFVDSQPVGLVVTLSQQIERMPAEKRIRAIAGLEVPAIVIDSREPSAPIKVEIALREALA